MITNRKGLAILLFMAIALVSCGGPKTVRVTLTDYKIESSVTDFQVGVPYHFVVANKGESNHEFMIMPPVDSAMEMPMEQMDELALAMIEDSDLVPGATLELDFTFTEPASAGSLEFACHTAKHYQAGMELPITVK